SCLIELEKLSEKDTELYEIVERFMCSFEEAMDDDFNTPEAIAVLFSFSSQVNRYLQQHPLPSPEVSRFALDSLKKAGYVLTLFQQECGKASEETIGALKKIFAKFVSDECIPDSVDDLLSMLLNHREKARGMKQWDVADGIRDELECLGFEIQDTTDGPVWRKRA
ncbi:MAG: hypothetical protein QCI00_09320, partial [Candidatus Thermoplasmatota archaeon]|nr:hypothetical protein [Candidatus Thermoplasmatota archaeon]